MKHASIGLIGVILVGGIAMWSRFIDRLIFQPTAGGEQRVEAGGRAVEDVFLDTEDGVRIHGFWLPAEGATRALLFLHGNAGNASHRLPNAALLAAQGIHVLLLDYRGYGYSEGTPREAGVYADARAGLRHLERDRGIPANRIVVFGRSLGGAVAVDLVQDRPVAGVILESTFTSIEGITRTILPLAAPLLRGRFDSERKIAALRAPLLVLHGDQDELVSYALGRELFLAAPEPKSFETIAGAGHNDTVQVGGRSYLEKLRRFIDAVAPE